MLYTTLRFIKPTCELSVIMFRYKPASEDQLMKAFQTLDTEGQGFLTQEQLSKLMMEEGELIHLIHVPQSATRKMSVSDSMTCFPVIDSVMLTRTRLKARTKYVTFNAKFRTKDLTFKEKDRTKDIFKPRLKPRTYIQGQVLDQKNKSSSQDQDQGHTFNVKDKTKDLLSSQGQDQGLNL